MFELGLFCAFKRRTYLVIQLFSFIYVILQLTAYRISHITTEGKRLIKTVLCSDKDTKYFKSKQLMAVKFELRTPQAFLFLWCRSLLFQWLFAAINLCLRRNLDWINGNLTTVTGRWWKLEVGSDSSPEAFTSDLSEHSIFLVFIWYRRQYDLVSLFLQVAFLLTCIHLFIWFCNFWSSWKTVP